MNELSDLLKQIAALAEQRSRLLAAEAKWWADSGRLLNQTALVGIPPKDKTEAPIPARDDGRDRLLSTGQAADILNLAPSTLNKWRVHGGGPEFVKLGGRIFYKQSVLAKFVAGKAHPHTSAYK